MKRKMGVKTKMLSCSGMQMHLVPGRCMHEHWTACTARQ